MHGTRKKCESLEKRGKPSQTHRHRIGPRRKSSRKAPDVERLLKYRDLHPDEFVGVRPFEQGGTWPVGPVDPPTAEYLEAVKKGSVPGVRFANAHI